jgi:phosphate transport system substrate-binding protein
VTRWRDPAILALNPGVTLPDLPIASIHRSDSSGTSFILTHYLSDQLDAFDARVGPGKAVNWPVGLGAAGNDGVARMLALNRGSIGYLDLSVALQNRLPFAVLKNQQGRFVKATSESVSSAGEASADAMKGNVIAVNIRDQRGDDVYPISSFTYIVVYKDLNYLHDPAKAEALYDFLRWSTTRVEAIAPQLNYAPLGHSSDEAVQMALNHVTWTGKPASEVVAVTTTAGTARASRRKHRHERQ